MKLRLLRTKYKHDRNSLSKILVNFFSILQTENGLIDHIHILGTDWTGTSLKWRLNKYNLHLKVASLASYFQSITENTNVVY